MITKVKLKNWKSHDETELELGEGTNVLVGIMGSGKSAVLDAITYGLFGTIPSVKNRKISLDDLIKKRPVEKESAEVEIEFEAPEGNDYKVKRVLERGEGTTYAELREANSTLINKPKPTEVTRDVTSLLQIDYDFFERMIYAEQNQLDRFLTLEPRKRRRRVDELLKINKFEEARKNSTTLINRLNDRKSDREKDLRELKEDEEIEELPKLEKELEESRKEKRELKQKKEEIKPVLQELENELKELEKIGKDIEQISKKIESRKGKIEALDNQIAKAEKRLGEEISIEELKEKAEGIGKSLEKKEERVEELEEEKSSITAKISELETEKNRLRKDIAELEDNIEDKEKQREELENLDLERLSEEIDRLREKRESLRERNSELKAEVNNLEESLEEIKEA